MRFWRKITRFDVMFYVMPCDVFKKRNSARKTIEKPRFLGAM